jgi:hypothetical protein
VSGLPPIGKIVIFNHSSGVPCGTPEIFGHQILEMDQPPINGKELSGLLALEEAK